MALSISASACRPLAIRPSPIGPLRSCTTPGKPSRTSIVRTQASAVALFQIAAETGSAAATKIGSVNAPDWVLPVGVVAVTTLSILSGYLLKPGADAAAEIRERDAKSGRYK